MWINRPLEEPTVPFSDASNLHPKCRGIQYFDSMVNAQCDKGVILAKKCLGNGRLPAQVHQEEKADGN